MRFLIPTFVPDCEGFGTIVTAFFFGFGVGLTVGFGVAVGSCDRSVIVTFTFCPGRRLSICTFALEPDGLGAILSVFLFAAGELLARGVGEGVGVTEGFGVGEGVGVTEGFGVGEGVGVTEGFGVGAGGTGAGVGAGVTGAGVGAGVTGAGVGSVKVTVAGEDVAVANEESLPLLALTIQVPAPVDVTSPCAFTEHPVAVPPASAYVMFPEPLPPPTVTVTVSPIFADPPANVRVACDDSATPIVTLVVAVFVSEPINTDAVIVTVIAVVTVVGVPDIVPVAV